MTNTALTGQMLHEAFNNTGSWDELSKTFVGKRAQVRYDQIAKQLNQELGFCGSCGNRPADGVLLAAGGEMLCTTCMTPPTDAHVQLMYVFTNPDGTLAGVVVPPLGMSLEDYQKQLQEEMEHISFVLSYEGRDKPGACTARTVKELANLITKHVPIATPERSYTYSIQVLKDTERIGYGTYKRMWDDFLQHEEGAAEGLSEVVYACAFHHI